jgi:hypothetical protein
VSTVRKFETHRPATDYELGSVYRALRGTLGLGIHLNL